MPVGRQSRPSHLLNSSCHVCQPVFGISFVFSAWLHDSFDWLFFHWHWGGSQVVKSRVKHVSTIITSCKACLDLMVQDASTPFNICKRHCHECETTGHVCPECDQLGYTTTNVLFRPRRKCLASGSKCHCLLPLALSAVCASAQQSCMESFQREYVQHGGTSLAAPLLPFPDPAHVIKCV